MSEPSDLMTSAEVAAYFRRKSTETVRRWHRSGKLPAAVVLDSGELLWARADVEAFRVARAPAKVRRRAEEVATLKAQLDASYARSVIQGRSA